MHTAPPDPRSAHPRGTHGPPAGLPATLQGIAIVMESAIHLARVAAGPLLPCPFCGGDAAVEADPWGGESVRVTCASAACPVTPRTEYLLVRFAGELSAAWNARPAPAAERVRGACNPFGWR